MVSDIPLPPAPPPLGATWTDAEWNRAWSYADLILRIEAAKRAEAEVATLKALRESETAKNEACVAFQAAFGPQVAPTLDRVADAWDALDAALNRLATALGAPAPTPPPPPIFNL